MFHNAPTPMLEYGSIGWEDESEYVFPGDDSNDGHTLVRVQLFRGRDPTKPLNPSRAQGLKLIAHVNSLGGFRVPPKDTRCMVAVPAGMESTPGAAIIMGIVERSSDRPDNLANGNVSMSAGQGMARVLTNNDGSVSLFTTDDNTNGGKSVYIRVASDGITFNAPWGTIRWDHSGFHLLHSSGACFDLGGIYGLPAPLDQLTSYVRMQAASIIGEAITQTFGAGVDPIPLTDANEVASIVLKLQSQLGAMNVAFAQLKLSFDALAAAPTLPGLGAWGAAWPTISTQLGNVATNVAANGAAVTSEVADLGTSTSSS